MKKKLLVLTLALAVMLMGAGYAWWTDQLTISNTVSTGELDLFFVDQTDEVAESANVTGSVTYTGTATEPNNSAALTLTNMYPGAEATVNLVITNDSTIPVKLASAGFSGITGDWSQFTVTGSATYTKQDGTSGTVSNIFSPGNIVVKEKSDIAIQYKVVAKTSMANNTTENKTYTATVSPVFQQFNQQ